MRIRVVRSGGFAGLTVRGEVDTAGRPDQDSWDALVREAALDQPPPDDPRPDRFRYQIQVDGRTTLLTEHQMTAPQRELARRVLGES
jgi:hypothetical protein